MSTLNVSARVRAAITAARNPDRIDQPNQQTATDSKVKPWAAQHQHGHLASTSDETWAFYRLHGVDWDSMSPGKRARHVLDDMRGNAALAAAGVTSITLRGMQVPFPIARYLDGVRGDAAVDPAVGDEQWILTEHAVDQFVTETGRSRPLTILGVRVASVGTKREHMPMLLTPERCQDHLGVVDQTRVRIREVTAILDGTADPLTPAEMKFMFDGSIGLGMLPVENPGPVRPVADWYGDHIQLHRDGQDGTSSVRVQVWHATPPVDYRLGEVKPLLGWLSTVDVPVMGRDGVRRPAHIEWVARFDVKEGRDAARKLRWLADRNRFLADDAKRGDRHAARVLDRSDESADETGHGSPQVGFRASGPILVAVTVPHRVDDYDGRDVKDAAQAVVKAAARQRATMRRLPGQYRDWRLFVPCEPWPAAGAQADRVDESSRSFSALVPGMTYRSPDQVGWPAGVTRGTRDVTVIDPWGGSRRNTPNLVAVIGEPGSGKTTATSGLIEWTARQGHRVSVASADPLIARLAGLDTMRSRTREIALGPGAAPGLLAPGFLVPERPRHLFDSQREFEAAARSDASERRDLTVDLALKSLPWSMQVDPRTLPLLERAAAKAAVGYGFEAGDVIDAIARDENPHGRDVAAQLAVADPMIWHRGKVDPDLAQRVMSSAQVTIVTTPGLETPPPGTRPESWTSAQRRSVPVLTAAAWLASRDLWADRSRKLYVSDETGITSGSAAFSPLLTRIGYDSRKHGISAWWNFQTMHRLLALEEYIVSLFGAACVFATGDENAKVAMRLLGSDAPAWWLQRIQGQRAGQMVWAGWRDPDTTDVRPLRAVTVDRRWWSQQLVDATYTTPAARIGDLEAAGGVRW